MSTPEQREQEALRYLAESAGHLINGALGVLHHGEVHRDEPTGEAKDNLYELLKAVGGVMAAVRIVAHVGITTPEEICIIANERLKASVSTFEHINVEAILAEDEEHETT